MLAHAEEIVITFINLIVPLVGIRILLDYMRIILFKD